MRPLAEDHAAAFLGAELLGPPGPIEEIREVERLDHTDAAEFSARYKGARAQDRGIEAVAVTDDQMDTRLVRGIDHGAALRDGQRHRLLDQDMLAPRRGKR